MSQDYTRLLEKHGYTEWLTVVDSRTLKSPEIHYEFHFKVDGRAAKFYALTRVEEGEGIHKEPRSCPKRIGEEITKHYPKLQPIVRWEEFERPKCLICDGDLLYSEEKEEYFCPFCNHE